MSEKEKKKDTAKVKKEAEAAEQKTAKDQKEQEKKAKQPEKIEVLEKELEEMKDRHLRTVAEYDNFRKRTQKEKAQIYEDAKADTVETILPIMDNLDRALEACSGEEDSPVKQGVEMIAKQAYDVLAKLKVSEIPALGETFDPEIHNAIMHIEDDEHGEGEIVEVFQKGYRTEDKVIRHSIVKVAN